jgi:hypothetical protein
MAEKLLARLSVILIVAMVIIMTAFTVYLVHDRSREMNEMIMEKGVAAAKTGATIMGRILDGIVDNGLFTIDEVFDRTLVPINLPEKITNGYRGVSEKALSSIRKYHYATTLDSYLDNVILDIEDEFLKDPQIMYAVLVDANSYLPTHNSRYSIVLTGNFVYDRDNNRTKRIFSDEIGLKAAQNTHKPFLKQVYQRDTGEVMWDISSPVFVKGRHWGGVRVGFSIDRTEQSVAALRWKLIFLMGLLLVSTALIIAGVTAFVMKPMRFLHRGVGLSLRLKISVMIIFILAFALLLNVFLNYFNFRKNYSNTADSRFFVMARDLRNTAEYGLGMGLLLPELKNIQEVIDEIVKEHEDIVSIAVFNDMGQVIFDTDPDEIGKQVPPEWVGKLKEIDEEAISKLTHKDRFVVFLPLMNTFNIKVGGLTLSFARSHIDRPVKSMFSYLFRYFSILLVISAIVIFMGVSLFSRDIVRDFSKMQSSLEDFPGDKSGSLQGPEPATDLESELTMFRQKGIEALGKIEDVSKELERIDNEGAGR